jgi:hypothetical protein
MSDDYNRYRANKLESGRLYQDFVVDVMWRVLGMRVAPYSSRYYQQTVGESPTGVEIKHDEKYAGSGNLYIELAEKAVPRPGAYAASGIHRGDNTNLFVIGDYDTIFVFPLHHLLALEERYRTIENRFGTSRGFLLPDRDARLAAVWILAPAAAQPLVQYNATLHQEAERLKQLLFTDPRQTSFLD